jgi:ribosomal protein S12 methylthiotransferase accessory factor
MECLERSAQFGCTSPRPDCSATGEDLRGHLLDPESLGLYDRAQYARRGFPLLPFDPRARIEWVKVRSVAGDEEKLVPVEFIYPRSILGRGLLVSETSSGTAAHFDKDAALVGAICELIERDCFMVFWHRQPPTPTLPIHQLQHAICEPDVSAMQGLGWVITVCDLNYDLGVPCFLAIALRGSQFACGLGCNLNARIALEHAFHELTLSLAHQPDESDAMTFFLQLSSVRAPEDHSRLYTSPAWNELLRDVFARVLQPSSKLPEDLSTPDDSEPAVHLSRLLDILTAHGFVPYWRDLTPDSIRLRGVWVVRAVVPGLIPIHFGSDRLRMACSRLRGASAPGRFQMLLPHFYA